MCFYCFDDENHKLKIAFIIILKLNKYGNVYNLCVYMYNGIYIIFVNTGGKTKKTIFFAIIYLKISTK